MANLLYITADYYNTNKLRGGMGTKTKALQAAWGVDHKVETASELDSELMLNYDVIIIELLGFRKKNKEKWDARIETLKSCNAPILVYGSDSEIFRWTGEELDTLKALVNLWIPNMEWQGNYFRDFDLPVSDIVCEPIDCDLFRPSDTRKKVIIAGGAISHAKQSEFFIELFEALKDVQQDYKTAYLGGHIWGGNPKPIDMELRHELKSKTDIFYGEVKQEKVASTLGTAGISVLNPHYETCNRFDMELMASGNTRLCGPHVCYDERLTASRFDGSIEDCVSKLSELTENFMELPDKKHEKAVREYAIENFSYEASREQLNGILRRML